MRRALQFLPRLAAAVFLALLTLVGAATLARPLLGERLKGFYLDRAPALLGMQVNAPPLEWGPDAWLAGKTQEGADAWVNNHLLQRPAIVRAFNSAQWETFGTSYMANGSLVRGRDDVLFEWSYIGAHCGLRTLTDVHALPPFARRIKAVQDALEARGQQFVYVIAAVKTPYMDDYMPPGVPCQGPLHDMSYAPAMRIFREAGVRVVDTREVLWAARRDQGVPLFPRNGIHWNRQGAALASRAMVDELRRQDPSLRPLTWGMAMAPDETGGDRDLSVLLNLWREPPGWPAPVVAPTRAPPSAAAGPTLAAVNDSFFGRMAQILQEAGTFQVIRAYGYFTLEQIEYRPEGIGLMSMEAPAIREHLLSADVVVLEEVESRLGGPFAAQFLEVMEPALGLRPPPPPEG